MIGTSDQDNHSHLDIQSNPYDLIEQELVLLLDKFSSCNDIILEIQEYVKKNREEIEGQIVSKDITGLEWLYFSLQTLAANRIEKGGFVQKGVPDIQGMEYLQVFDYTIDRLAQLGDMEDDLEFLQQEKETFRDYLSENFG